jgi:hypothetical protein
MSLGCGAFIYRPRTAEHYRARAEPRTSVFFDLRPTGFYDQNAQGFSVDFIVKA